MQFPWNVCVYGRNGKKKYKYDQGMVAAVGFDSMLYFEMDAALLDGM